jgi:hypothetical protein
MCKTACLPLAKWKSNHPDFIKTSSEPSSEQSHSFEDLTTKILGNSWQCKPDTFTFKANFNTHNTCTKRAMLSEIAQLFNPLGLISLVVIQAKILMQQLWLEKVNWEKMARTSPRSTTTLSTSDTPLAEIAFISTTSWLLRRISTGNGCSSIHQSNKSKFLIHRDITMLEDEGL